MEIAYNTAWGSCYHGLAEEILGNPDFCKYEGKIDLIFTSPPFPLNRKKKYGNLRVRLISITIFSLIIYCMSVSFAFSGTWSDDFKDGDLNNWRMVTCLWIQERAIPNLGNWAVEDVAAFGGDDDVMKRYDIYTGDTAWQDYIVGVSVKFPKSLGQCPDSAGVWLGVRYQEGEGKLGLNAYCMGLQNFPGPETAAVGPYEDGKYPGIQRVGFPTQANTWYRLKIEMIGDQFKAFVDDIKVGAFQRDTFTSGPVFIGANGVRAMFDDFVVIGPDIPDGGPGFAVTSQSKIATIWGSIKRVK